ncbi:MAG: hypothetical protein ACKVP0_15865 [Pirellulaceae bacterium]
MGKDGSTGIYAAPPGGNKLARNMDGSWTETLPAGDTAQYDTAGKLSSLVSTGGTRWTMTYSSGLLASVK